MPRRPRQERPEHERPGARRRSCLDRDALKALGCACGAGRGQNGVLVLHQTADALVSDVLAIIAVRHADFFQRGIGGFLGCRKILAQCRHAEHAAAAGNQHMIFDGRAAVENLDAGRASASAMPLITKPLG